MVRVAGAWDKWKTESQMEMKPIRTRPVSTDWLTDWSIAVFHLSRTFKYQRDGQRCASTERGFGDHSLHPFSRGKNSQISFIYTCDVQTKQT